MTAGHAASGPLLCLCLELSWMEVLWQEKTIWQFIRELSRISGIWSSTSFFCVFPCSSASFLCSRLSILRVLDFIHLANHCHTELGSMWWPSNWPLHCVQTSRVCSEWHQASCKLVICLSVSIMPVTLRQTQLSVTLIWNIDLQSVW